MLFRQLADKLEAEGLDLKISHLHKGVSVQTGEITSLSDLYSYCSSITGLTSRTTSLLFSVTSDNNQLLSHKDPLKDLLYRFTEKWSFYPDTFLGKRSRLIRIFSGVHPDSVPWDSTAKIESDTTKKGMKCSTHLQVTIKPFSLDFKDKC